MGTSMKKRMEDIEPVAITTKAVNLMEVRFLLSCETHLFERIISIRGEFWTRRTNLTLPLVTLTIRLWIWCRLTHVWTHPFNKSFGLWTHITSLTLSPWCTKDSEYLCICMLVVSFISLFLQFPDYILELFWPCSIFYLPLYYHVELYLIKPYFETG